MVDLAPAVVKAPEETLLPGRRRIWQAENMAHTFLPTDGLGSVISETVRAEFRQDLN